VRITMLEVSDDHAVLPGVANALSGVRLGLV
jgi:hypothetical protein